jgi:hypothetical protein
VVIIIRILRGNFMPDLTAALVQLPTLATAAQREQALAVLDELDTGTLLLTDSGRYVGVVHRDQIIAVPAGSPLAPAIEVAEAVPRFWVDGLAQLSDLTSADLEVLALLVGSGSGLVVEDGTQAGFLPWESLADALVVPGDTGERDAGLGGTPDSPVRCYICCRCDPPLRRLPRRGREAPVCPANLMHGLMERETV